MAQPSEQDRLLRDLTADFENLSFSCRIREHIAKNMSPVLVNLQTLDDRYGELYVEYVDLYMMSAGDGDVTEMLEVVDEMDDIADRMRESLSVLDEEHDDLNQILHEEGSIGEEMLQPLDAVMKVDRIFREKISAMVQTLSELRWDIETHFNVQDTSG